MRTTLDQYGEPEHDPSCTGCKHSCPWRANPMGAPFCSICDDHYEASNGENEDEDEDEDA